MNGATDRCQALGLPWLRRWPGATFFKPPAMRAEAFVAPDPPFWVGMSKAILLGCLSRCAKCLLKSDGYGQPRPRRLRRCCLPISNRKRA
jgi:hypothetical protein